MEIKSIKDIDVKNKRVLVRCDFNVPISNDGKIVDDFRIQKTIPLLKFLKEKQAKIILISHLGRPQEIKDKKLRIEHLSLKLISRRLKDLVEEDVKFLDDCVGKAVEDEIKKMKQGKIVLLENLRFYRQEQGNNIGFAKSLSLLGDIFVNEAFSVSHKKCASIIGLPKFLPSYTGFLFEQEVNALSKLLENPKRPVVGIIGGIKLSKIKVIPGLVSKVDSLLIGGNLVKTILFPRVNERKLVNKIKPLSPKIKLPVDMSVFSKNESRPYPLEQAYEKGDVFDIGPESAYMFSNIIKKAKTIFWAGPLGKIEKKQFSLSSVKIAEAIIDSKSLSVAGGGETISFLKQTGHFKDFSYICSGGGAMLEFLSAGTLCGIESLKFSPF